MTEEEKLIEVLNRMASIAMGMSYASRILGYPRNKFVRTMYLAVEAIRNASSVTFQGECPGCGKRITLADVNGERKVNWE